MELPDITLLTFGFIGKPLLDTTAESVRREFMLPVVIHEIRQDLGEFYNPARRQYDGHALLKRVEALASPGSVATVGLFNVDIYVSILTYIFGQAILGGSAGIASAYRLSNERYGMPADEEILAERFGKEVIHELGHMAGLIHCHQAECVMRGSTYVEDIDQKNRHICPECRSMIRAGFSGQEKSPG